MTFLTIVKMVHLVGLMMGFGGAVLTDFVALFGAILKPIDKLVVQISTILSKIVFVGLFILWGSGAILLYIRISNDSIVLTNEKIWAKVAIVTLLTINGFVVHRFALHRMAKRVGQRLFDASTPNETAALCFVAAVSSVSWIVPFVLGTASELNYRVAVEDVLGAYANLIIIVWLAMYILADASTLLKEKHLAFATKWGASLR